MKVLAIIVAVLILWFGIPHIKRNEWVAPNPLYPDSWTFQIDNSDYAQALATPPQGYGWRRFDFWNQPPLTGRPVEKSDFRLRNRQ